MIKITNGCHYLSCSCLTQITKVSHFSISSYRKKKKRIDSRTLSLPENKSVLLHCAQNHDDTIVESNLACHRRDSCRNTWTFSDHTAAVLCMKSCSTDQREVSSEIGPRHLTHHHKPALGFEPATLYWSPGNLESLEFIRKHVGGGGWGVYMNVMNTWMWCDHGHKQLKTIKRPRFFFCLILPCLFGVMCPW